MQFRQGLAYAVQEPLVIRENKSSIARITLNRPSAYNSLDKDTVNAFQDAIKKAEEDPKTKAIFLRGKGKAFCAGGDVKYLLKLVNNDATNMTFRSQVNDYYYQVYRSSCLQTPLISVLDGFTMGFGVGISIYGPFRIVTENTKYSMPETKIGTLCESFSTHYLSRLDCNLAKYITMTGNVLKGEDALFAGIGTHFVPSSRIDELEDHLSKEANLDLDKINNIIQKYSVDENHKPVNHVLNAENNAIIQKCFKFDNANDIINALEKDGTPFSSDAIMAISKGSPTCTVINAENFNRASKMSFSEVLEMELTLWFRSAALHDFSEGINSALILKKRPQWNPPTIKDVSIDRLRQEVYRDGEVKDPTVYFPYDPLFTPTKFLKYTLPSREAVLKARREHNLTTLDKTVQFFQAKTNNKFGIRQKIESMGFN
ncbi:ClpP/crotonase [Backusella circina FSU 941]|nr:ClpP/crotonase [Backusella circina FSU 941]